MLGEIIRLLQPSRKSLSCGIHIKLCAVALEIMPLYPFVELNAGLIEAGEDDIAESYHALEAMCAGAEQLAPTKTRRPNQGPARPRFFRVGRGDRY